MFGVGLIIMIGGYLFVSCSVSMGGCLFYAIYRRLFSM